MPDKYRIEMFGGLCVRQNGQPLPSPGYQYACVLVYLALRPGLQPRGDVIAAIWPDLPHEDGKKKGRDRLNTALSVIRDTLGSELLESDRYRVGLNPKTTTTDLQALERLVARAEDESDPARRTELLSAAVSLYRGPLLPDFYDELITIQGEHALSLYLQASKELVEHLLDDGDGVRAVEVATNAVAVDPLWQEGHLQLMRAYQALGRPRDAMNQYRQLERLLERTGDGAPWPVIHEFFEELETASRMSNGAELLGLIPAASTSYHRPDEDLGKLMNLLLNDRSRLVTITGFAGVGKTRIAIETAQRVKRSFPGGVWFIALDTVSRAEDIPYAIARDLGPLIGGVSEPRRQIAEFFGRRRSLLVLDNFEHLVPEGAAQIDDLLDLVPGLTCLATSRVPVGNCREIPFPLEPLAVPGTNGRMRDFQRLPCCKLLLDRAQAANRRFRVTLDNGPEVAELLRRLEGIPLAIELVAAWAGSMNAAQMLACLEQALDHPIGSRSALDGTPQTLRRLVDASVGMLPAPAREVLPALSVFRGGWTANAARAVCARQDVPDALAALVRTSLIQFEDVPMGDKTVRRFTMFELVRSYGAGVLQADDVLSLARRHGEYHRRFAMRRVPKLAGRRQAYWIARIEAEHDNLRAAIGWGREHDFELALEVAASLPYFWDIHGHWREGYATVMELLRQDPRGRPDIRAKALLGAGNLAKMMGDYPSAEAAFHACLPLLEDDAYKSPRSKVWNSLGIAAQDQGNFDEAQRRLDKSYALKEELGDKLGMGVALANMAYGAYLRGSAKDAKEFLVRALSLLESGGNNHVLASALNGLGAVARMESDFDAARKFLERALNLRRHIGDQKNLSYSFQEFAALAWAQGSPERAARLIGATESLREELGYRLSAAEQRVYDSLVEGLKGALGEGAFEAERLRGAALSEDQAVLLARQR